MGKSKFSMARRDEEMLGLVNITDHKILAVWAIDCALRVLPCFEEKFPEDDRLRKAIETLREWIATGLFKMSIIRKASLDAHAAAREVEEDNSSRSAARACGQAVATAHVPLHAYGSAIYAQQAIYRDTNSMDAVENERNWQYQHLLKLRITQQKVARLFHLSDSKPLLVSKISNAILNALKYLSTTK